MGFIGASVMIASGIASLCVFSANLHDPFMVTVSLLFFGLSFGFVASELLFGRARGTALFALCVYLAVVTALGISFDAYAAHVDAPPGDRLRQFAYVQTARRHGVPVALKRFGARPNTKR